MIDEYEDEGDDSSPSSWSVMSNDSVIFSVLCDLSMCRKRMLRKRMLSRLVDGGDGMTWKMSRSGWLKVTFSLAD